MAALLVAMSVMAVLMSALLPVLSHLATREKEEELIFRGKQYARAIGLFQRKFANTAPPTIDLLVEQRFLRKKYKDPITNDDFQPIYANQAAIRPPGGGPTAARPGQSATQPAAAVQQQPLQAGFGGTGVGAQGGVIGVTSKSKGESIKIYNGRTRYNEVAQEYNVMVKTFPMNLFAGMFGYRERPYYQLTSEDARNVPKVSFPSAPSAIPDTAAAH